MSVKFRHDESFSYTNTIRVGNCGNEPTSINQQSIRNYAYTDATRHRKKPRHLIPTYLRFVESIRCEDTTDYECKKYPCGTSLRSGFHEHVNNAQSYLWTRRSNPSRSQINASVLAAHSGFTGRVAQYGESLSELDETGKMMHARAKQLASVANALRTRNFGRLESLLSSELPNSVKRVKKGKELANGWLELEFGWKPLVQDVYAAVELYRNGLASRGQMVVATGSKSGYYKPVGSSFENRYSNLIQNQLAPRIKSRSYGVVRDPNLFTLNELGLANPALLAWQLLPFSFVVDWFLPISQILGMMSNRIGISNYAVCVVYETNQASKWRCSGVLTKLSKTVTRDVRSSIFTDVTRISPRSLGLWHAATSAALIRQAFGR